MNRFFALQKTAPKASKGRRESEVQAGIMAYLGTRRDLFWWRQNVVAGMAPSGRFVRSSTRGVPDLLCVKAGRLYGLEVKREQGGRLTLDQERWGKNLEAAGGVYCVARCVEDVARALGPEGEAIVRFDRIRVYHR